MNEKLTNALLQAKALLDNADLEFFLVGGTLLGLVREGDLMEHDKDVDVAVFLEDLTEDKIAKLKGYKQFKAESKSQVSSSGHLAFNIDGMFVDVFPYKKIGERRYNNPSGLCGLWWPENLIGKPFGRLWYRGIEWNVPCQKEDFLTHMFGDWKVVDKEFGWRAKSLNFVENINEQV